MLKFWKRAAEKQPVRSDNPTNGEAFRVEKIRSPPPLCNLGEEEFKSRGGSWVSRSRLSQSLLEVLKDRAVLPHWIQYLDTRGAGRLGRFWLDVENFRLASSAKVATSSSAEASRENLPAEGANNCDNMVRNNLCVGVKDCSPRCESEKEFNIGASAAGSECGEVFEPSEISSSVPSSPYSHKEHLCNDALRICRKYLSLDAAHSLSELPTDVREGTVEKVLKEVKAVAANRFDEAQSTVFEILEKEHFNDFLRSEFYCKHQIDILTSGKVQLSDVLYNETALFYFMEFLEQEGRSSLLEFWLAAENFQGQHGQQSQSDSMILYDRYFSLQATCPLGFSDAVRFALEQDICQESGPDPDCFHWSIAIVLHTLESMYLQPFLQSQLYFQYLNELITTVQSSPSLLEKRRKSGSDCSSEYSISMQNTLLASESINPSKRVVRNVDNCELRIDSRQLSDPDSLWRRRHQSQLSIGRINELGKFETEFEPEPDRRGESRISRVVKKLVNMEEDKAKEDMAWQIAEMIVKDVTSITMGSSATETATS